MYPVELSPAAISHFVAEYKQHYGVELSPQEAACRFQALLCLLEAARAGAVQNCPASGRQVCRSNGTLTNTPLADGK